MEASVAKNIIESAGVRKFVATDGRGDSKVLALFVGRQSGSVCAFAPRSRTRGSRLPDYEVAGWQSLVPVPGRTSTSADVVAKFKRYAAKATFTNRTIRNCAVADEAKSCYENGLSSGTRIDGQVISLAAVEKVAPYWVAEFRAALRERVPGTEYHSPRFDFRGYDGSLWLRVLPEDDDFGGRKGDVVAGFSKEYRNCGNGYYYTLINDDNFMGVDID